MSWIDKIENSQLTITTGDGNVFTPLWKNSTKERSYNIATFDFIDVEGSLIDRKQPQSAKYPLTFWFQGEDNIEQADAFEESANDSRPWTVNHPFYGTIIGQPISIRRDDTSYNVTEITVELWETIDDNYPATTTDLVGQTNADLTATNLASAINYGNEASHTQSDVPKTKETIDRISGLLGPLFEGDLFSEFQVLVGQATSKADNLIAEPQAAIQSIQNVISAPSLLDAAISLRLESLLSVFDALFEYNNENQSAQDYLFFESLAASVITSYCQSCVNPSEGDFETAQQINQASENLLNVYNAYLLQIDTNQVQVGESLEPYIPDAQTQLALNELVYQTTVNLFSFVFDAKRERQVVIEKESNLILLTHMFVGLDVEDENLEQFRQINNIRNKNLFKTRKGAIIKYYV